MSTQLDCLVAIMNAEFVIGKEPTEVMCGMYGCMKHILYTYIGLYTYDLERCFSTAGPQPGTGPWHQLYRAARGSPGICHFSFLSNFHE